MSNAEDHRARGETARHLGVFLLIAAASLLGIACAARGGTSRQGAAAGQTGLLNFVQTVTVTPDVTFKTGSFSRINYVPSRDCFVVTFGSKVDPGASPCGGAGFAFKEYTLDMQETGECGWFVQDPLACEAGDSGSVMVGDAYYLVIMPYPPHRFDGWLMLKYEPDPAGGWKEAARTEIFLDASKESSNDPMVAFVNGEIDVSAQHNFTGSPPPLQYGAATHHRFFSEDLAPLGQRLLADTPHICGSSMVFVDGVYYLVTGEAMDGAMIVMKYDASWNYLGKKELVKSAHWSQGLVFDGERFYVSYLDTSLHSEPGFLPVSLNVHLAAFDRDFNLLEDVAVTDYGWADLKQPGRPWVILHDRRLYVSYDMDTIDPATRQENLRWQAYVSIYEIAEDR